MHICMYVFMHICMYYAYMYLRTYARMYVCMYVCMHVCMHAWLYVCVCMYLCMRVLHVRVRYLGTHVLDSWWLLWHPSTLILQLEIKKEKNLHSTDTITPKGHDELQSD